MTTANAQTFFMYFLQDIIQLKSDPEGAVAKLSIIGQLAGAFTCVPVGIASDKLFSGTRKPFVYFACFVLAGTTFSAIFARTMNHMIIIMSMLGGANGVYLTMDTSLAVDTLPKEFDGSSGSAQLLGIWGVAAFLGSALGPMIGGPILYFVGAQDNDDEAERSGYSLEGYAVILSLSSVSSRLLCIQGACF
jgi:sugar phosphate permease